MKLFFYKGSFYKIDVIKSEGSIIFKCVMVYSYDLFCWDIIRTEFNSNEYTLSNIKSIQEEIINKLNDKFRLKNNN